MTFSFDNDEVLAPIIEEQRETNRKIDMILSFMSKFMLISGQKSVMKVSDIANLTGKGEDRLRGKDRWMLPRFGESAFPSGPARWPLEETLEWIAKPDSEKQRAYAEHVRQRFAEEARKRRKATV